MKTIITIFLGAGLLLLAISGTANAALFDFMTQANALEKGYSAYSLTDSGITVTATGTSVTDADNSPDYFAYLDAGNAGLGVCKSLNNTTSAQCAPSSDDNLTHGELLTLDFGKSVTISEILFRDDGHVPYPSGNGDDFALSIDGGSFTSYLLQASFTAPLVGQNFRFAVDDWTGSVWENDSDQLYIQAITATAPVPEPSTILLFGAGLAGLVGYSRKKKK